MKTHVLLTLTSCDLIIMLLHEDIRRPWLVPQALEKTNIFVVDIEQRCSFWGRERVGGTRANRLLKIKS